MATKAVGPKIAAIDSKLKPAIKKDPTDPQANLGKMGAPMQAARKKHGLRVRGAK